MCTHYIILCDTTVAILHLYDTTVAISHALVYVPLCSDYNRHKTPPQGTLLYSPERSFFQDIIQSDPELLVVIHSEKVISDVRVLLFRQNAE